MIVCENCFKDIQIKEIIAKERSCQIEECPSCGQKGGRFIDVGSDDTLTPYFENLLTIYTPDTLLEEQYPDEEKRLLIDDLFERWKIFENIDRDIVNRIIKEICKDTYENMPELFDGKVGIAELYDENYCEDNCIIKGRDWEKFAEEIKTYNRYHVNSMNRERLQKYCTFIRKQYKKGAIFFRSRISSKKEGFEPKDMGAPPKGKSSDGRANARGIECLYLSSDEDTTLHEIKAGMFDYVSIGKFELKKDITVVNLTEISEISPFTEGVDVLELTLDREILSKMDFEIGKPLRREDSTLDYVPTQYLVDSIKKFEHDGELEYQGIEYRSTVSPGQYNLAIFYPELFECVSVATYDVTNINYEKEKIAK